MNQLCKEPGAEKPHAGICRRAGLVTGRSTRPLNGIQEVSGSIPLISTIKKP